MKSPITGKEMKLSMEERSMVFRKESFKIIFHFYKCEDSGEQFTTTELDEVNMNQIYNQYRDLYNIPFADEITMIREKYGLTASKMSEILGLGANSYRQYEAGDMPSVSNARLVQMVDDPRKFIDMAELCGSLDEKIKTKYIQKARHLIEERKRNIFNFNLKGYLLGNHIADIYSGYRNPNFDKFAGMVVFFAEKMQPFKTKMNKLLFYADFLMFKKSCFSISGVRYRAIDMGPVPNNFHSIYEFLANEDLIEIHTTTFPNGYVGEQFQARSERPFNEKLFSEKELMIIHAVSEKFMESSTSDMVETSHLEEAWKQNKNDKQDISYKYAFELTQI